MANSTQAIESLAADIGENIYIDIAKWHLYLREAHLHTAVAEKVYPLLVDGEISASAIADVLRSISVSLGGGQREVPLAELIPKSVQTQLVQLLEDAQKNY